MLKQVFKSLKFWMGLASLFGAALIALGFLGNFEGVKSSVLSPQKAGEAALSYINESLTEKNLIASLVGEVERKNEVYCFKLSVQNQKFDSCISLDGKLLFPQIIDLTIPLEPLEETENEAMEPILPREIPEVYLYTMSYCPYGNQAEEVMYPVQKLLGKKVKIEPHYVIYSNYHGGGPDYCLDKENKYCSMHGIEELNQDVRELCIYKYQPEKFWDYLMEVNQKCSLQDIRTCWEKTAKEKGIDTAKIIDCQEKEVLTLLEKEAELNKKYNVLGSPTVIINEAEYKGKRSPEGYKNGICSGFQNPPEECKQTLEDSTSAATGGCQ